MYFTLKITPRDRDALHTLFTETPSPEGLGDWPRVAGGHGTELTGQPRPGHFLPRAVCPTQHSCERWGEPRTLAPYLTWQKACWVSIHT